MAVGAAASLAVLQPTTVSGCMCAVAGGVIGGWICDIDVRQSSAPSPFDDADPEEIKAAYKERAQVLVLALIVAGICFAADYFAGDGMCAYISSHLGLPMALAAAVFIAACIVGNRMGHRTATHSILGGVVLTGAMYFMCAPMAPAFAVGFISHVALDLFNKTPVRLFWPLKFKVGFGLCSSGGRANTVIGIIGLVAALALLPLFLLPSLAKNESYSTILQEAQNPSALLGGLGISSFQLYLIVINVVTFLVYVIDHLAYERGAYGDNPETDNQEFVHMILLLLPLAGGAVGMLLAVLIGTGANFKRGGDGNLGFYIFALAFLMVWVCIYLVVCNPFGVNIETSATAQFIRERHIIPIAFAAVNILSFIVFLVDKRRYRSANAREIAEFILALVGGATGAFIAMALTGHKMKTVQFGIGVPVMMAVHFILLAVAFYQGLI